MQRAGFTTQSIGSAGSEQPRAVQRPPAVSEADLRRLHDALSKQEAWTAKAVQEQQGLYQRLRAAEARLLAADTDAAAARHQLDADDATEAHEALLGKQQKLAELVRRLRVAIEDGDRHLAEERHLVSKIRRQMARLQEQAATSSAAERAARAQRPAARCARIAAYICLNVVAAALLLAVVNYRSVGQLIWRT